MNDLIFRTEYFEMACSSIVIMNVTPKVSEKLKLLLLSVIEHRVHETAPQYLIAALEPVQSCTAEAVITALRGNDSYHRLHVWVWKSDPTWRAHPTACSSPQHKTFNCFATTAA